MTTKVLYYIIGGLIFLVIGISFGWYLTVGLAGGGIVAALTSWIKKDQKLRVEGERIEEESRKKQLRSENEKKKLLVESKEKEKDDNSLVEGKSDDFRNDLLDKLADEFKGRDS